MRNRAATWVNFVFACIIVIGVFFQAYFIASYASGAGEGALDAHGFTGGLVIHGSELIVFLSALVAFWRNWRWIAVCLGLFVFGTIQIFLAPPDDDPASGWVHGLHGLLALFVLLYAAYIAYRDAQWLGLRRGARAEAVPHAPPPA
jgi:hypothetical protein